jgi:hypothetical protein
MKKFVFIALCVATSNTVKGTPAPAKRPCAQIAQMLREEKMTWKTHGIKTMSHHHIHQVCKAISNHGNAVGITIFLFACGVGWYASTLGPQTHA